MSECVIRDVPVRFPFKPYKVQEDFMNKVLECIQQKQNGVLESPTGTGKTLSLLCSSLAWLETKKALAQATAHGMNVNNDTHQTFNHTLQLDLEKSAGVNETGEASWNQRVCTPQIIYASRTHAQISQAMKEFKRTSYSHLKSSVLGSRDQLCLHPDLAKETAFLKVALCRAKVKARTCHYYSRLESLKNDSAFMQQAGEILDIEELGKLGHKNQCCPYYLARESKDTADIVFMPYNYLLHPQTRRVQKIDLNNAVVLLDEAHNVEKICEESASVHTSSTDIALCIDEVTQVMKKLKGDLTKDVGGSGSEDLPQDFTMEDLCDLKTMFLKLEEAVDGIELDEQTDMYGTKSSSKVWPGSHIFLLFKSAEIVNAKLEFIETKLVALSQFLSTTSESPLSHKGSSLVRFNEFLKVVFDSCAGSKNSFDTNQADLFYKVYVEPEGAKENRINSWSSNKAMAKTKGKVVNFWCFSPGFAMRSLLSQNVHCVILTSGTMAPLQATVSELGIPIPVLLENPHIIQPSQVCVAVMHEGPTRGELLSTYYNRNNPVYLADLGRMLVNFCRVIPSGILVFFPSYVGMEKAVNFWQENGLWSQINAIKPLFAEPRRQESLAEVMQNYNTMLEAEGSCGAVLLAVLRGKVSEGMDFADQRCRAVIVTGLPYAPFLEPKVKLKKEYANNMARTSRKALNGHQWYELDATRAVNQAIGRVIRHANDFGAILLCDKRFEKKTIINSLSAWLRPLIVQHQKFESGFGHVSKFFKAMNLNPPVRPIQAGASFDYPEVRVRTKQKTEERPPNKTNPDKEMQQFLEKVRVTPHRATPQPPPQSLLQALDVSSAQNREVAVKKTALQVSDKVGEAEVPRKSAEEVEVVPAKRRKLRIVPLQFDSSSENNPEPIPETTHGAHSTSSVVDHKAYLRNVKRRLSKDSFIQFGVAVKAYSKGGSYDEMVICLRRTFSEPSSKDLFLGFKNYIKRHDVGKFEDLCFRMFGSTT